MGYSLAVVSPRRLLLHHVSPPTPITSSVHEDSAQRGLEIHKSRVKGIVLPPFLVETWRALILDCCDSLRHCLDFAANYAQDFDNVSCTG